MTGPLWVLIGSRTGLVVVAVGLVAWAIYRRNWRLIVAPLVAVIATDLFVVRVLKPEFDRPRPCRVLDVRTDHGCSDGESLPSAHAANMASVAASVANPALGLAAAAVGVSRVVEGQHYPSDVVAGWAVGASIGALVHLALRQRKPFG